MQFVVVQGVHCVSHDGVFVLPHSGSPKKKKTVRVNHKFCVVKTLIYIIITTFSRPLH